MDTLTDTERAYLAALEHGDHAEADRLATLIEHKDNERRARLAAPGALAAAALWSAQQGIAVFPLRPHAKIPLTGTHGFKDASADPAAVAAWWAEHPDANIGAPTGLTFDVIDVDGPAGYRSLADLRERDLIPTVYASVKTPRGTHLYMAVTGDGNTAGLRPGIDVRGLGGYVVVPPSVNGDGRYYSWSTPLTPDVLVALRAAAARSDAA